MKVSIRPAPHSKGCAVAGREWCGKFDNNSERCENECPAGYCCEMKHCWQVGEKLRDILIERGHEVLMANKHYRKGSTDRIARDNTAKAINELMAWKPDVHIAIHTNASSDKGAYGIKIGYPQCKKGGTKEKIDASRRLAECIAETQKGIYYAPGRVSVTDSWDFEELSKPKCPAVYIEGCYANSNKKDAQWWHENMDAIVKSYADALEAWWVGEGNALLDLVPIKPSVTPEPPKEENNNVEVLRYAKVKATYIWKLSLWSDSQKTKSLTVIDNKSGIIEILSEKDSKGYFYCRYDGKLGYVDGRYLTFINKQAPIESGCCYVRVKDNYTGILNIWSDTKKTKSLCIVPKGLIFVLLSNEKFNEYYYCSCCGHKGYVNSKYVQMVNIK